MSNSESLVGVPLLVDARTGPLSPEAIEAEVLMLFDTSAPALLRYVGSFGLGAAETEDVVQEVFILLFRHLRLGRSRSNLRGWLFRVAHNQALKRRRRLRRRVSDVWDDAAVARQAAPGPTPEVACALAERHVRLQAVFAGLPERDRRCVLLRSEGLRYREIASVLGVSLGTVAKSLARSIARLVRADEG